MRTCTECGCYLPDGVNTCLACHHVEGAEGRTGEVFGDARPDNTSATLCWQYAMPNNYGVPMHSILPSPYYSPPTPYSLYRYYGPYGYDISPYQQLYAQLADSITALNQQAQQNYILQNYIQNLTSYHYTGGIHQCQE